MDVKTLLALAQNAVDVGNIAAAQEFYEVALTRSPNNIDVLEAYAELMIHYVQDIPRAKQMLQHAIAVDPEHGHVKYLNLAQLCEASDSLACYQRAVEVLQAELLACGGRPRRRAALRSTLASVHCAVAELHLTDLCEADGAEGHCAAALSAALAANPQCVEAHQLLGSMRLSQGRPEEAQQHLHRAVELTHRLSEREQPTYESKVELARLLMQVAPDEAHKFLLEILQLGDNNPYIWFLLGETARIRKRYIDSARLLRRARVMLTITDGDVEALKEVDAAISVLVNEMGGPAAAEQIPDLDHPNPIELLLPEEDEDIDDEEVCDDDDNGHVAGGGNADEYLDEPEWESCDDDDDD